MKRSLPGDSDKASEAVSKASEAASSTRLPAPKPVRWQVHLLVRAQAPRQGPSLRAFSYSQERSERHGQVCEELP